MSTLQAPLSTAKSYVKKRFEKICLVDADFLKYYVTGDIAKYWESTGDPALKYGQDYVMHFVRQRLDDLFFSRFDCWAFIFCFSGGSKDTFRYRCSFEKEYKGTRKVTDQGYDRQYEDMAHTITCVSRTSPVFVYEWLEADDLLSALHNEHTMIYSDDKDMKQLPGAHYSKEQHGIEMISEERAVTSLAAQMVVGDTTDNICGIPGVGPVGLSKIFEGKSPNQYIASVYQEYVARYGVVEGTDRFAESWMLLKLRMGRGAWFTECIMNAIDLRDTIIHNNLKP